jgi:hemolysin activation/secretion protein
MFSHDTDKDYEEVSYKGKSNYVYGRVSLERITRLPKDFSLLTTITGQASDANLLASEQLSAGGYATVRGYHERVANAEEGIITTVELRTPSFAVLSSDYVRVAGERVPSDQLQFLTFWDYANLERHDADDTSPAPKSYSLSSTGVGLRYTLSEYMSVRFDYGWQIKDSAVGKRWDSRGHVGVVLSY